MLILRRKRLKPWLMKLNEKTPFRYVEKGSFLVGELVRKRGHEAGDLVALGAFNVV